MVAEVPVVAVVHTEAVHMEDLEDREAVRVEDSEARWEAVRVEDSEVQWAVHMEDLEVRWEVREDFGDQDGTEDHVIMAVADA